MSRLRTVKPPFRQKRESRREIGFSSVCTKFVVKVAVHNLRISKARGQNSKRNKTAPYNLAVPRTGTNVHVTGWPSVIVCNEGPLPTLKRGHVVRAKLPEVVVQPVVGVNCGRSRLNNIFCGLNEKRPNTKHTSGKAMANRRSASTVPVLQMGCKTMTGWNGNGGRTSNDHQVPADLLEPMTR